VLLMGLENAISLLKIVFQFSKMLNIVLPYDLAISLLGI
jgi:hypothetical protein